MQIPKHQRTLRKEVLIVGMNVHTGEDCPIRLRPASANSGVTFISSKGVVHANLCSIATSFSTTALMCRGFYVEAVEHLLSCFYGLFIDNVEVEMYGDGLPIMDGSAIDFCTSILEVGLEDQKASREVLHITRSEVIGEIGGPSITIAPSDRLRISYTLDYPHSEMCHGSFLYEHTGSSYLTRLAYARTFASNSHIAHLKKIGKAKGACRGNCIVIEEGSNPCLKVYDEPVRHKILDLLGDLSLLYGVYVCGEIFAYNAGHSLHHELTAKIANF